MTTSTVGNEMNRIHNRAGFTAIELAVVMGVILLMVGLTLPAISRSMRKGRLAESVNTFQSMHQQAMSAAQQYQMTYGVTASDAIKLEIVQNSAKKTMEVVLTTGGPPFTYIIPPTIEAESGFILYTVGTGLPSPSSASFHFQTIDGKDQARIFIAASGLTKVESQ